MSEAYAYTNAKGTYYLHSRKAQLAGKRPQIIYYFRSDIDPEHALTELPDWAEVTECYQGLPIVREKPKTERPDFGLVHPASATPDTLSNYELGRTTTLRCPNCGATLLTDETTVWCGRLKPYCGFGLAGDVQAAPFLAMEGATVGND